MKEIHGNLWDADADAIVITTNGTVKKNGEAVMGRGVARQAALRYPTLPLILGSHIKLFGNDVGMPSSKWVCIYGDPHRHLVFFPVKHHWREEADLILIRTSTRHLVTMTRHQGWKHVALPRPGCGNGGLNWKEVKPVIEPLLDDRFVVYNNDSGG